MKPWRACVAWLILGLALSACAGFTGAGQPHADSDEPYWLTSSQPLGQTFLSEEGGLAGLEFFLAPDPAQPAAGTIELRLLAGPDATAPLAQASLPLASVNAPGFYRLDFPALTDSLRRDYFAQLTLTGTGRVRAGAGPGLGYTGGALYLDGEPAEAQLAFRLVYAPVPAAAAVAGQGLRWLAWLAVAALLILLPGWMLVNWLWPNASRLSWGERLGLAAGAGCAPYPVLYLWTHLAGVNLGPAYAWIVIGAASAALLFGLRRARSALRLSAARASVRAWWAAGCGWPDLALAAVLALVVFSRWWAARGLDLPLWGDSLQHTMVVQLIHEHGGLFTTWEPYAELSTFTYHFGFHVLVASFQWLTGLSAAQATLWMGQILNVVAVVALYPLGVRLGGSRWGGVAAVLAAGLLSPHPAYYLNWGRYTQLAGQVLLPAAVAATWALVDARPRRGLAVLGALLVGALALTHYRVLLMYGLFVVALLMVEWRQARALAAPLAGLAAGAILLALPWLLRTLGGPLLAFTGTLLTTPAASASRALLETAGLPDPRVYPWPFWLLAGLGLAAGWRWRRVWVLGLWWVLLVLGAHPAWLGLPGTGVLTNFAVLVAGYIGGAAMAAAAAHWLTRPRVIRWAGAWGGALALLVLWGAGQRMQAVDVGRDTAPTRADQRAAAWISTHLPPEARLLTKTAFGYSGTVAVGADAGVWLPLLAGRAVTTPPINYAMEQGARPGYRAWVEALPRALAEHGPDDPAVLAMLRERAVTHVYVGHQWNPADGDDPLAVSGLLASDHYRPVYHEDRVWVFEVVP